MNELYSRVYDQSCFDINEQIVKNFDSLSDDDFKEKTHMFNGRYENIYLQQEKIPGLETIIKVAKQNAAKILNVTEDQLMFGFWLNAMNAGDVTTAHTHDDDDELLSCVYYIMAPENSGDLIITVDNKKTVIPPEEGNFVFFSPDTLHEVSENKSGQSRLSIAFNFGLMRT